jgi:hypothetical protein
MAKLRSSERRRIYNVAAVGLLFGLTVGCVGSKPLSSSDPDSVQQQIPFHSDIDQASGGSERSETASEAHASVGLPFRAGARSRILPPGTLLTVDLNSALATPKVKAGDPFTATVAAPLTVNGETLVPPGTAVTGRIESAQSQAGRPGLVPGSGYFQLTLNTITVDGRPILLQTSSLFARGTVLQSHEFSNTTAADSPPDSVRVRKGRPLTFRLTAPVALDDPKAVASASKTRQSRD